MPDPVKKEDAVTDSSGKPVYVVTISGSFGAGGSVIGPAVADRLGIPFVDRVIPIEVAHSRSRSGVHLAYSW